MQLASVRLEYCSGEGGMRKKIQLVGMPVKNIGYACNYSFPEGRPESRGGARYSQACQSHPNRAVVSTSTPVLRRVCLCAPLSLSRFAGTWLERTPKTEELLGGKRAITHPFRTLNGIPNSRELFVIEPCHVAELANLVVLSQTSFLSGATRYNIADLCKSCL